MQEDEQGGSLSAGALVGGRFQVIRLIGRGGMGEVYAARHTTTGKEVALKLIVGAASTGKEHVRRFLREARAATAIQHPNVIEVLDVFEDAAGTPVMVMELLKGEPFSKFRERTGALRLHEVAEILLPIARGLKAAHEKAIVHRDLKPDNVFLATTPAGRTPKLLDFGIAKMLDPAKLGSETQGQHTNTGSILGTPHYMSYEQAMSDKRIDQRTDIWAMGVMIFEALTGLRPLAYDTLGEMYTAFLQRTVPRARDALPGLPADFADVLDGCLAKLPEGRLADLGPLIDVLAKYEDPAVPGAREGGRVLASLPKPSTAPAITNAPLSRSVVDGPRVSMPRALIVGAALATCVAAGVFLMVSRRHASADQTADHRLAETPPTTSTAPTATSAATTAASNPSGDGPVVDAGPGHQSLDASPSHRGLAVSPLRSSTTGSPASRSTTVDAGAAPTVKGIPEANPY